MDLRCLVFSSDDAAAPLICQALAELGAEADHCPDAAAAIGRVASESFQIVIADWDEQPNAEYLLKAARARKSSERALTLAIVSDDASVPKALQAGANSVLRKPILANQVRDTLETARSLLKAKQDSATAAAHAAASSASGENSPGSSVSLPGNEAQLRAGDFLTSAGPAPGAQFDTESEPHKSMEPAAGPIDPLKELEPMAAAVSPERPESKAPVQPQEPQKSSEPRGLQWHLNQRAASLPSTPSVAMPAPLGSPQPELMGYDQMAASPDPEPVKSAAKPEAQTAPAPAPTPASAHEQATEAKLFSYITDGSDSTDDSEKVSGRGSALGKRAIMFAMVLAACAIVAAPQAPWHPATQRLWTRGGRALHAWLNPQVVEPAQAPETHENFGRAGDEYKLPVSEPIPDATTDPSQIRVEPVIDPTAKKPDAGVDPNADGAANSSSATPPDGNAPGIQVQANPAQPNPAAAGTGTGSAPAGNAAGTGSSAAQPSALQPGANPAVTPASSGTATQSVKPALPAPGNSSSGALAAGVIPAGLGPPQKTAAPILVAASTPAIPSSLKSQMASTVPDAGGNRAPETALPSIEPVAVSEPSERALLTAQPAIAYPDNAKGQQGTVILQLLIGRDGSVQDAKFLQGSLAFARAAIDGVKSWKFKPYVMNGRPVSVQTQLTLSFRPGR